jgi:GH25 family lysozyme M1 (1,4-beta-N-acetylmuramidase)
MKKAPIDGIQGIDISSNNGISVWSEVDPAIRFVSIRASCGLDVDSQFKANRAGAHALGLPTILYFALVPGHSIAQQVQVFLNTVGELLDSELPPSIDWELHGVTLADVKAARVLIEGALSRRPIIYSYPSFIEEQRIPAGDSITECDLWVSHTGVTRPHVPAPWTHAVAWQWCGDDCAGGPIPGVPSSPRVDGDVFLGDEAAFQAWLLTGVLHQMPPAQAMQPETPATLLRADEELDTDPSGLMPTLPGTPTSKSSQRLAAVDAPIVDDAPTTERSQS